MGVSGKKLVTQLCAHCSTHTACLPWSWAKCGNKTKGKGGKVYYSSRGPNGEKADALANSKFCWVGSAGLGGRSRPAAHDTEGPTRSRILRNGR